MYISYCRYSTVLEDLNLKINKIILFPPNTEMAFAPFFTQPDKMVNLSPLAELLKPYDANDMIPCEAHGLTPCDECQMLVFRCSRFKRQGKDHYRVASSELHGWTLFDPHALRPRHAFPCCMLSGRLRTVQTRFMPNEHHRKLFASNEFKAAGIPLEDVVVAACNTVNLVLQSGRDSDAPLDEMLKNVKAAISDFGASISDSAGGLSLRFMRPSDFPDLLVQETGDHESLTASSDHPLRLQMLALRDALTVRFKIGTRGRTSRHTPFGAFLVSFRRPGLFSSTGVGAMAKIIGVDGLPIESLTLSPMHTAMTVPAGGVVQASALPVGESKDAGTGGGGSSTMAKLQSLKQMLDSGLISEEDYDENKQKILANMHNTI